MALPILGILRLAAKKGVRRAVFGDPKYKKYLKSKKRYASTLKRMAYETPTGKVRYDTALKRSKKIRKIKKLPKRTALFYAGGTTTAAGATGVTLKG